MITVANIRDYIVGGKVVMPPNAVWVGRAAPRWGIKASVLRNPFVIGKTVAEQGPVFLSFRPADIPWSWTRVDRALSIDLYRSLLRAQRGNRIIEAELDRLHALAARDQLKLVCGCAPKPCHADVIKEYLEARDE